MFVSHYRVTRHYGGPEEGGWYYDRHEFVTTVAQLPTLEEAQAHARDLNHQARQESRQPNHDRAIGPFYQGRYSVANHTDDIYRTESVPGEHDDTDQPRPHYE